MVGRKGILSPARPVASSCASYPRRPMCASTASRSESLTTSPSPRGSNIALSGNLLHEADDAAPELRILDLSERFGERKPIGRREEVGHVVRRRRRALHPGCARDARRALEEECHWNLQDMGALL